MATCSQCGKDNDIQEFCQNCGSRITNVNIEKLNKNKQNKIIDRNSLIKIVEYLAICFAIDLAVVGAIMNGLLASPKSYPETGYPIIPLVIIIQILIYRFIVKTSDVTLNSRRTALFYFLTPTFHFIILTALTLLEINNETIFITLASLVAWGVFIGSVHVYIRTSFVYRNLDEATLLNKAQTQEITNNLNIKNKRNFDSLGYTSRPYSRFGD